MTTSQKTIPLAAFLSLALAVDAHASCLFSREQKALAVEVVRCVDPLTYFDILEVAPRESSFPKELRRREFAAQAQRDAGVVLQATIRHSRSYDDPFPEGLPAWTSEWQPHDPPSSEFFYLQTTGTCGDFEAGAAVQVSPARVCCDTGRSGAAGCWLELPTFELLPSTLRDLSEGQT
jgi:hypothetical protein